MPVVAATRLIPMEERLLSVVLSMGGDSLAPLSLLNIGSFRDRQWVVKIHGIFTEGSISLFRLWTNVCAPRREKPFQRDSPAKGKYGAKRGGRTYYENGIFLGRVRGYSSQLLTSFGFFLSPAFSRSRGEFARGCCEIMKNLWCILPLPSPPFTGSQVYARKKSLRKCILHACARK